MIPWFFFADSVQSGSNAILDNTYLVKKVVFQVKLLPVVKIYSALFVHMFFISFLLIMFAIYHYPPSIYLLQIPYYIGATFLLVLGINWIASSIAVFLKDTTQFITIVIQFGFWLTPIFYNLNIVP